MEVVDTGYKMTEVGRIPSDWTSMLLKDLIAIKNGYAFSSSFFGDKGKILITPGNFNLSGGLYFEPRNIKRFNGSYPSDFEFEYGDLIVVMTDLTPDCKLLGKPAFIEGNGYLHNQRIGKIVRKTKRVEETFLYWYFLSDMFSRRMRETATGSTVRHTSVSSITNSIIPLPPTLTEQKAIATALSDVDALISSLDKLIEKKKAIKLGAMQDLLTPPDQGGKRLEGFSGEWTSLPVKQMVSTPVTDGPHETPVFEERGIPFLSVNNIVDNRINWTDLRYISKLDDEVYSRKCKPQKFDLLLGKAASVGKIAHVEEDVDFNIWSPLALIRLRKDILSKLIFYMFQLSETFRQIEFLTNSSSQGNIGMGDIEKITFCFPTSIDEQIEITQILTDIDSEIQQLEIKRDKYKQIKQGMMQELLSGKTRLI